MFHHVLAQASEHPLLVEGQAPPGLLSPAETSVLAALSHLPRRRKWLIGRWAAKRLLREQAAALLPRCGRLPEACELGILNRPSGAPYVLWEGPGGEPPVSLSLSHREGWGLAAATAAPSTVVGADLETVEPRDAALVRQFFTAAEADAVARAARPDLAVARTWSAKEAVLKALGIGLRLDTRAIEIGDDTGAPAPPGWRPLGVQVRAPLTEGAHLSLLWRPNDRHVLTIALLTP